jgi:flavin-dependent dehydrogenase
METTDVVVIGGGPAGSTVATLLAQRGVRTTVVERECFPRFHVGESLLPQSQRVWQRLGVAEKLAARYLPKHGVRFLDCRTERTATWSFAEALDPAATHGYHVPRADFDDLLLRHAAEQGARVLQGWEARDALLAGGTVAGVTARDPGGIAREIRARVVVDASGRDTLLASRLCTKQRVPGLDRTALFTHFTGVERQGGRNEGNLDVVVFPHGWFWNIPFRGDVNSVGVVCSATWMRARRPGESLDGFFDRTVEDASWARRLLARARKLNPARAVADYSYRVDRYGGDGWILVGDAAGFVDPLFCSGLHLAFHSATLAADAIAEALDAGDVSAARWTGYERAVRTTAELFTGLVQGFYDGTLADRFFEPVPRATRQALSSLLAGDVFDPQAPWLRALRAEFPPRLPPPDGERAPAGASPIVGG